MPTIYDRLLSALLSRPGYRLGKPTTHYTVVEGPEGTFFLGRAGGLRFSKSGKVTKAVSLSHRVPALLQAAQTRAMGEL